jgi:hypothetical protein
MEQVRPGAQLLKRFLRTCLEKAGSLNLCRPVKSRTSRRFPLEVEQLEDRTLPSGLVDDVPAGVIQQIPLDATGAAVQLGSINFIGDTDVYSITLPVTGQTTIVIDGGTIPDQVVDFLVRQGQTFNLTIFALDDSTGDYRLTISTIEDDFPDFETSLIALNPDGSGSQEGRINYAGDEDVFRFISPVTGTMTLLMRTPDGSGLRSSLLISGASVFNQVLVPKLPAAVFDRFTGQLSLFEGRDHVVQFDVVQGREYKIRAAGADGSSGDYQLLFSVPVDDFSATLPTEITVQNGQSGSIHVPGDQDLFQFTADFSGWMLIEANAAPLTNFNPLVTPSTPDFIATFFGGPFYLPTGHQELTGDQIVLLNVTDGETYTLLVSGGEGSIGDYSIRFSPILVPSGGGIGTSLRRGSTVLSGITFSSCIHDLRITLADGLPPDFELLILCVAPVGQTEPPSSGLSNTRLLIGPAPTGNGGTAPSTQSVPSGAASPTNVLVVSLLTAANRDNAVTSIDGETAGTTALNSQVVASTLALTLTAFVGPGTSGGDVGAEGGFRIDGVVFDDRSGNGIFDATDRGVAGEIVVLEQRQGGRFVIIRTAATDAGGGYRFQVAEPGEYRVRVLPTQNTNGDYSTPSSYEVIIREGTDRYRRNFGTLNHTQGSLDMGGPGDLDAGVPAAAPEERPDPLIDRFFESWDEHFALTAREWSDDLAAVAAYWKETGLLAAGVMGAAVAGTIQASPRKKRP